MVDKESEVDTESLRTILAQAESLEDYITETDTIEPKSVRRQYRALREKVVLLDKAAGDHLLYISELGGGANRDEDVEELTVGISQLVAYLRTKVEVYSEEPDAATTVAPIVTFLETLQSRGLTIRWGIAASALSLVEVITDQTLAKLAIDNSGEFDRRLNRLSTALKQKGVEIPSLLLSGLYKVRSKVIHEGREPTAEEMTTIFQILNSLHEKTK